MTPIKSTRLSTLRRVYDLATAVAGVPAWVRSVSRILDHEHAFRVEEGRDWWTRGGDSRMEKAS